jgi:chromosome segregation ATPase
MDSLMNQVNSKFQEFFTMMGFAGEVQLDRGKSENDFANYGIEILVKFRENMPLQKLDPYRQSGRQRCTC